MALGFAPPLLVRTTFTQIEAQGPVHLQPLYDYFRQQWLTATPPAMWNVYQSALRTNNDVEGWHNRFSKAVNKHHPNIWHFITCLITEQAMSEVTLQQIAAGQNVRESNKKYVKLNSRINRLRQRFAGGRLNVMEFVTGVSHNMQNF